MNCSFSTDRCGRFIVVVLIVLVCGMVVYQANAGILQSFSVAGQAAQPLWLHVTGNQVLDSNNHVFIMKGVAPYELSFQETLYQSPTTMISEMAGYGANTIRLPLDSSFWFGYSPPGTDASANAAAGVAYRDLVDSIVT